MFYVCKNTVLFVEYNYILFCRFNAIQIDRRLKNNTSSTVTRLVFIEFLLRSVSDSSLLYFMNINRKHIVCC